MKTVIINQQQVYELLPMDECIEAMEAVLMGLARGECTLPLRQIMWLAEKVGAMGLMPAYWSTAGVIGLKAVTFFPGNEGTELDTHQGAVLLYDGKNGRLLAIVDGTSITALRTAAVSGAATRALAKKDSKSLAILGSGVQAGTHLQAMLLSRPIEHVKVFSKTPAQAERFASAATKRHSIPVEAATSAKEAVMDADIICTTTSSNEPVLFGEWLGVGVHINAVGTSVSFARELDGVAVQRSRLYVDRRESALNEAGDFLLAKKDGLVDDDHIVGEVGEVLVGRVDGRSSNEQITLFKSVGLAVEDLAAAKHVYDKALTTGVGTTVELGGARHAPD